MELLQIIKYYNDIAGKIPIGNYYGQASLDNEGNWSINIKNKMYIIFKYMQNNSIGQRSNCTIYNISALKQDPAGKKFSCLIDDTSFSKVSCTIVEAYNSTTGIIKINSGSSPTSTNYNIWTF